MKKLFALLSLAVLPGQLLAATTAEMDCLFNWGEKNYPQFFSPAGAVSHLDSNYYRDYANSYVRLGVSSGNHLFVSGPMFGGLLDLGDVAPWVSQSGCVASVSPSPTLSGTWNGSYSGYSFQYIVTQNGNNLTARIPATGQYFTGTLNGSTAVFVEADSVGKGQSTVTLISSNKVSVKIDSCSPSPGYVCVWPAGTVMQMTR